MICFLLDTLNLGFLRFCRNISLQENFTYSSVYASYSLSFITVNKFIIIFIAISK